MSFEQTSNPNYFDTPQRGDGKVGQWTVRELQRMSHGHLLDLKRAGHRAATTELVLAPSRRDPLYVPVSSIVGSPIGSPAQLVVEA